jgi:hypothetical protein
MTTTARQIEAAIAESVHTTCTVEVEWSRDVETEALARCEDSADLDGGLDVWGTDDDGGEWRLMLRREEVLP